MATTITSLEQKIGQQKALGYGDDDAKTRAATLHRGEAHARGLAMDIPDGHYVAIEYGSFEHGRKPTQAIVLGGRMVVDGVSPPAAYTGRILSQPYRITVGSVWDQPSGTIVARLAGGEQCVRERNHVVVNGQSFASVMDAAIALIPSL